MRFVLLATVVVGFVFALAGPSRLPDSIHPDLREAAPVVIARRLVGVV